MSLTFEDFQQHLDAHGMDDETSASDFVRLLSALYDETDRLLMTVSTRYPEAARPWRRVVDGSP